MSLLRRVRENRMPRVGEVLKIYQHDHMLAHGYVVNVDRRTISIAGQGIVDLDTDVVRRGIHDGSVRIERGLNN
ncbi:MAG: hypothetical protein LCI00_21230 [Chloroflexi bacterium]|nr:hypothetical protein [Chloroflexota bacterium]MCC6892367.1 hypothetical protein [Anaerolineae bacterium]